jgi:SAM-dependent methyltransferase
VCGGAERTLVNPWNKFILIPKAPDQTSARYDYSVCHGCGVLYATRRPVGGRYNFLLAHFGEVVAKRGSRGTGDITNRLLNPYPLTDADRDELRRLSEHGVFVSDHLGLTGKQYLAPLLRDRFENCVHTDIIGSLLEPRGARVVEVRSRAGTILDGLRRAWGATVYAMPIWESQQFLLRELFGITTSPLIDFEHFTIPFDGEFDLIICNHMFTHALRPRDFFAELRRRLKPGGHIYLYHDPDDVEFLGGNQSMFATLNPLHMQAFDQASLVRALAANGFETVFIKGRNLHHLVLARLASSSPVMKPMTGKQRDLRVDAYRQAFDRAVLGVDEALRPRVAAEWPAAVERAVAAGVADYDERGRLRLVAR